MDELIRLLDEEYCNLVIDKVIDYYQRLQKDDDYYTVKSIRGKVIELMMRQGFDELGLSLSDMCNSIKYAGDALKKYSYTG
ncbi:MAG: hypothetical protein IJH63_10380 [Methanobrevibacter sp.]|nr:hypothetical protein [Methanosphaera sp.]MBR0371106.1 hypothetical protein [Methanobrevibacter sp.]